MEFLKSTRIGEDEGGLTQDNLFNKSHTDYMLESYYKTTCNMKEPIEFATSQANVNYCAAGGNANQCDLGGCNIDQNSELLLGSLQTHPKCRISLFQRTFLTVPYLGKGPYNPDLESKLQQTDTFSNNKKSVNTMSEISYMPLTNYPLLPAIQESVTNPAYLVEGVASNDWVRGGIPSRELSRDYAKNGQKNK
jgi:hypothetical protein